MHWRRGGSYDEGREDKIGTYITVTKRVGYAPKDRAVHPLIDAPDALDKLCDLIVSVRRPPSNTVALTRRDCHDSGNRVNQLDERVIIIASGSQDSRPIGVQI